MDATGNLQANKNAVSRPSKARTAASAATRVAEVKKPPSDHPEASGATALVLPLRAPGRPKGYAKSGGRARGTKNHRTKEVEEALRALVPAAKRKLKDLMDSGDDKVAYSAVMAVFSYVFGKPVDRREIGGPDGTPLIPKESLTKQELAIRLLNIFGGIMREQAAADPTEFTEASARSVSLAAAFAAPVSVFPKPEAKTVAEPEVETEPEPTEPAVGQLAYVGSFIVECVEGSRPGLPPAYRILNDECRLLTQSVGGWEGAMKWIGAKAGDGADMTVRIEEPNRRFLIATGRQPDQQLPAPRHPEVHRNR